MDKISKILETPDNIDLKRGWGGMYKLEMCSGIVRYVSQEEYKVMKKRETLHNYYHVPEKVIDDFESVVRELKDDEDSYNSYEED